MTLDKLIEIGTGKIISYIGDKAIEAVKQNGDALQYVKDQTVDICTEAVKQNGYALRYVKDQTVDICTEAVKQDGYALQYVNPLVFDGQKCEMTIEEIDLELGKKIKIVGNK